MDGDEDALLHSVALQNARSIMLARQRAEQELSRANQALEAKTEALAQALAITEASLRERDGARAEADDARRAAQAANEAKSRFLRMISHELRTPLGAIGGYSTLLAEGIHGPLNDEQRTAIVRIQHNQAHLLHLVNELLDLAKIESGQFVLNYSDVSVGAVVDSVYSMIEPQVRANNLRMKVDTAGALRCYADRERVEQIVLNLLSNAVKFTPAGGTVRINVAAEEESICLFVQDTGMGIPADKLEAVFEAFVQLDAPTTRAGSGTGLGLAISRELARAMSGDLTATSDVGKGSTFTLTLPKAPRPALP